MKKYLLLAVTLLAFQTRAEVSESRLSNDEMAAPTGEINVFHVTPVLGVPLVRPTGNGSDYSTEGGFQAGGLVDVGGGWVGLQTGLLYNSYLSKVDFAITTAHLHIDYLSIPILAKVNLLGNTHRTVYLKAGVEPSFLTYKQVTLRSGFGDQSSSDVGVNSFDVPAVAGIGGEIQVAHNKAVVIEATYLRSLSSINNRGTADIRNEGLVLAGGFAFGM